MFIYKVDEELIGPGVNPVIIREEMSRAQEANERGRPKRVRIVTSFKYNTRVRKTDLSDPNLSLLRLVKDTVPFKRETFVVVSEDEEEEEEEREEVGGREE